MCTLHLPHKPRIAPTASILTTGAPYTLHTIHCTACMSHPLRQTFVFPSARARCSGASVRLRALYLLNDAASQNLCSLPCRHISCTTTPAPVQRRTMHGMLSVLLGSLGQLRFLILFPCHSSFNRLSHRRTRHRPFGCRRAWPISRKRVAGSRSKSASSRCMHPPCTITCSADASSHVHRISLALSSNCSARRRNCPV